MTNTVQCAPEAKFRVVGYDSFSHEDWLQGDFDTYTEAFSVAREKAGSMTLMHIYDDKGKHLKQFGTF